jgi:CRP/FNR family cyclic AMP-dependent transcriptional regulator
MAAIQKNLNKGDILFREGDPSDAAYVVKTGRISITKAKGNSEIELKAAGPGEMFGEMAFFDSKPRSASAKASSNDTVVVALPFSALNAQFQTFPQWLRAMIKTINENLREANKRIKNLEQAQKGDDVLFPPHTITKLTAIISLVGTKYGEKTADGVIVPSGTLRNYTIQVFQEATHKMQKMMTILQALDYMKVEDLGEGRQRITVKKLEQIGEFVDFYNKWLFTEESKRVQIEIAELKLMKALSFYGKNVTPNDKGLTKINLTQIQNESMKDLGYLVQITQWSGLIEKAVISDKISEPPNIFTQVDMKELDRILPFWELVYAIQGSTF